MKHLKLFETFISDDEMNNILDKTGGKNLTPDEQQRLKHAVDKTDYKWQDQLHTMFGGRKERMVVDDKYFSTFTNVDIENIINKPSDAKKLPDMEYNIRSLGDMVADITNKFTKEQLNNICDYVIDEKAENIEHFLIMIKRKHTYITSCDKWKYIVQLLNDYHNNR